MSYATTDLSDSHPEAQVVDPVFRHYGGRQMFHGPIKTLKVYEDNAAVRAALETPGEGRVLVVDGGGSARCALVGGNLGLLGVRNGWAGILVYGFIRDTSEIGAQQIGVMALGTHPRKSEKGLHSAQQDRVLSFAGTTFRPGAWLYADSDGIVVSDKAIHGE